MDDAHLAYILAGEAGTCGMVGMLAVAWVYSHNQEMYGWGTPSTSEYIMAMLWYRLPDITNGRKFVFSDKDMTLPYVKRIVKEEGRAPPVIIPCKAGHLWIW